MAQPTPPPAEPVGEAEANGATEANGAAETQSAVADGNQAPLPAGSDRSTRQAAIWATVVALPLTVLVALFAFSRLVPVSDVAATNPTPSATAPRPQSTAPVSLPAGALAERPATVCRALLSRLPSTLGDLAQRPVTAGPEQNAAYGDPAVTVVCGSPLPSFPPTDFVWGVNSVCWHVREQADETVFVTVDREVPVQVTVPRAYDPPLQLITPIADSVVAAVPSSSTKPTGCNA
jgi:hypothetical protein